MGKKLKLPSLFRNKESAAATTITTKHPWHWPSCNHATTHSFRADDIFRTVNSVFLDPIAAGDVVETPESWFTSSSSESASFSAVESEESGDQSLEMIIHRARSERLFFEPSRGTTSSILENVSAKADQSQQRPPPPPPPIPPLLLKESVMLAVESENPYGDFRQSMEEMVECHGLRDWECLEGLLEWYLRMNGKKNHGFIVGAFIDLLLALAPPSSIPTCSDSTSFGSAVSSLSSVFSGSCSIEDQKGNDGKDKIVML